VGATQLLIYFNNQFISGQSRHQPILFIRYHPLGVSLPYLTSVPYYCDLLLLDDFLFFRPFQPLFYRCSIHLQRFKGG